MVFVFVANFNILQNFEWVDFGAVVAFCELYNAVNTSNIPDINSIKRFLTIWYILTTGQSPCNQCNLFSCNFFLNQSQSIVLAGARRRSIESAGKSLSKLLYANWWRRRTRSAFWSFERFSERKFFFSTLQDRKITPLNLFNRAKVQPNIFRGRVLLQKLRSNSLWNEDDIANGRRKPFKC